MASVAEEFIYLEADRKAVAGSGLLTRPIGVEVNGEDVLAAIDALAQKHLLVPTRGEVVSADTSSQGVAIGMRRLRIGDRDVDYIDIACRISRLDLVFERLLDDLIRRLEADSSSPAATARATLDEWRALLRTAGRQLEKETVVGLVGELEVLRLLAERHPMGALDCWRGPTMSVHDFVNGGAELEVKATASVDGNFVSITNLDQLDPALVQELHLIVVHVREDETAASLDERIDALVALGIGRDELVNKVERAGYVYESEPSLGRFSVRSVRAWRVGDNFPGLRGSDLGEHRRRGVSRVRYELALDSAPPRLTDEQFSEFLSRWANP